MHMIFPILNPYTSMLKQQLYAYRSICYTLSDQKAEKILAKNFEI